MKIIESPESSNIARFGYEEESLTLLVEFKNGSQYQYYDVPQSVFEGMSAAASKGTFLAQNVKGKYRYARL
jgi:hypothetical protein